MLSTEPKNELRALGQRLKALRIARNDRQSDFAYRLGVSVPTLRKLENGDPTVAIGTWIEALWILDRLDDLKNVLVKSESLFDQWAQQKKNNRRQRVKKR